MFVSVVIVTRNRSSALDRCLQSVLAQDYAHKEIIVVDNGSSDDTLAMMSTRYPSITLLPQGKNTGAPQGRNIGIGHAKGELCVCIDDDAEFIGTQAISRCVEYFQKDAALACLSMHVVDQHDRVVTKLIPRRDRKIITQDTPGAMFSATGCALRSSAFREVGGFWEMLNPYFGEEPELAYRLLDKGYGILLTPHISVRHWEVSMERHVSRRLYYGTRNAPWLALKNLPWYSVIGLTVLSWGYFFLIALRDKQLGMYVKAIIESIKHLPEVYRLRKPIGPQAVAMLWRYSGLIVF